MHSYKTIIVRIFQGLQQNPTEDFEKSCKIMKPKFLASHGAVNRIVMLKRCDLHQVEKSVNDYLQLYKTSVLFNF